MQSGKCYYILLYLSYLGRLIFLFSVRNCCITGFTDWHYLLYLIPELHQDFGLWDLVSSIRTLTRYPAEERTRKYRWTMASGLQGSGEWVAQPLLDRRLSVGFPSEASVGDSTCSRQYLCEIGSLRIVSTSLVSW